MPRAFTRHQATLSQWQPPLFSYLAAPLFWLSVRQEVPPNYAPHPGSERGTLSRAVVLSSNLSQTSSLSSVSQTGHWWSMKGKPLFSTTTFCKSCLAVSYSNWNVAALAWVSQTETRNTQFYHPVIFLVNCQLLVTWYILPSEPILLSLFP